MQNEPELYSTSAPRIALMMNKRRREFRILSALKKEILSQNPGAFVELFDKCYSQVEALIRFGPTCILTYPFTSEGTSSLYYALKYVFGCHIATYRREGAMIFSNDHDIKVFAGYDRYDSNLVDAEIFWGAHMAKVVGDELVAQGKLKEIERTWVVGYPPLERFLNPDSIFGPAELPAQLRARLQSVDPTNTLLFVTGFHFADYTQSDIIGARDLVDMSSATAEDDLNEAVRSAENAKQTRNRWIKLIEDTALTHPEQQVLVKLHPVEGEILDGTGNNPYESLERFSNVWVITEPCEIGSIIPFCSILLHYGSTTAAEACLSNIPSIYVYVEDIVTNRTKYCNFTNTIFPSLREIEIDDALALLSSHIASPIKFELTSPMIHDLDTMFNMKIGQPYRPTADTARTLLQIVKQTPLTIQSSNEFLSNDSRVMEWFIIIAPVILSITTELLEKNLLSQSKVWLERARQIERLTSSWTNFSS